MSLLIKALEKAAKDHQETTDRIAPADASAPTAPDLTLEPLAQTAPARTTEEVVVPDPSTDEPPFTSARATTIVNAGRKRENATLAWARANPKALFFWLIGLFVVGYAIYLYLQITHPGWFIRKAPAAPNVAAANIAPAPIIVTSVPRTETAPPATITPAPEAPAPASKPRTSNKAARRAPASSNDNAPVPNGVATPVATPAATFDDDLQAAWSALNTGDLTTAYRRYSDLQTRDANNTDVWLGLAAVAAQQGDVGTATRDYMKVLELDPRNAPAQAGLLNLLGNADPTAAETRLKQLIAQTPSPFLYFTLGNTYADQNRWAEAQSAYFEAFNRRPDNPDYAYNLAVALEHINQPALAANFYQRALALTDPAHPAHFDTALAQARAQKLSSQ